MENAFLNGTSPSICIMGASRLDRHALSTLLRVELRLQVRGETSFAPVNVWDALRTRPDLVLVDADQPTSEIRDAVAMIPRLCKTAKTLVAGASIDPGILRDWASVRLDGYVVKDGGIAELGSAISNLLAGNTYFSEGVRQALQARPTAGDPRARLSRRESELLPLLARGMTLREAASAMTVSYKTADSYRTKLLRKLGVRDRIELVKLAIREKIVDP